MRPDSIWARSRSRLNKEEPDKVKSGKDGPNAGQKRQVEPCPVQRPSRDGWLALVVGVSSLAVYARTLAPDVLDGDSGELAFAPYSLGLPHPTGYPLYVLLGRLWVFFPLGNLAYRMNLLSAVFAAGSIAVLYLLARRVGAGQLPAAAASLALAFSPLFWSQSTIAEVYTLHALILLAALYLAVAAKRAPETDRPRQYQLLQALALTYGLGLAHHRTILLVAPGLIIYLWPALSRTMRDRRRLAGLTGLLALPLLLYLYIPLRAPQLGLEGSINWALGSTFSNHLARRTILDILRQLPTLGQSALAQFTAIGALIVLVGTIAASRGRRSLLLLSGLTALADAVFYLSYDVSDAEVFLLTAYVFAAIWLALGLHAIQAAISKIRGAVVPLAAILMLSLPAGILLSNYDRMDLSERYEISRFWSDFLEQPLEFGAAVVGDGSRLSPLVYYQVSAAKRPDLTVIGASLDQAEAWSKLEDWLDQGGKAYLLDPLSRAPARYQFTSVGATTGIRLAQTADAAPRLSSLEPLEYEGLHLLGYSLDQMKIRAGDSATVDLFWVSASVPTQDYWTYTHLVDEVTGELVAQLDKGILDYAYYNYPVTRWPVGETIRDRYVLPIPAGLLAGAYRLEAGIYLSQNGKVALLRRARLGRLIVASAALAQPDGRSTVAPVAKLGEALSLLDASVIPEETVAPGQEIKVTLRWQKSRQASQSASYDNDVEDYVIFVHLGEAARPPVTQLDGHASGGRYPTSLWDEGEIVVDERRLVVPMDTPPGEYHLYVGAYTGRDQRRLLDSTGRDRVDLRTVRVK